VTTRRMSNLNPFVNSIVAFVPDIVILRSRRLSSGPIADSGLVGKDLNRHASGIESASTGSRRHQQRAALTSTVALLCILFAGCGAARPCSYYQLTPPSDNAADAPPANAYPVTILVAPLMSSHLYREDHIVYSSNAENMGVYEYQRWAEPPTEMIQDVIFRSLRSSGRYRSVHSLRSSVRGDYLLHGHLYDFKEISGSPMSARLNLELEMRDTKTGETVWTHLYNHDEPVSGKDVSAVVAALDRNVQRATSEIAASLAQFFSAHPPAPPSPAPQ
jgi:cholesterol transport system auxiliary component